MRCCEGDTYRAVYTLRFAAVVYVLNAFQKKSKRGIATPKHELDLIEQRLKRALLNGRLANFSSERLMRLLAALGQDVEITVRTKPRNQARGHIRVVGEEHA